MTIGVEIGQRLDGRPLVVALEEASTLVAGLPGAGKSSTLRCVIAGAALRDDVALVLLDPKRVELPLWRARAALVAVEPGDVTAALVALVALVDARFTMMEAEGVVYWPRSAEAPQVLVVVDELAELVDSGEPGDADRERLLRRLLSKGRAAGVVVVAATQRPSHDVVSTSVRDLFSLRIAHACATREASAMILGRSDAGLADALPIGAGYEGLAFVIAEGERDPVLARVDWLDPARARQLSADTAGRAPALTLPAAPAVGLPGARSWSVPPSPVAAVPVDDTDAEAVLTVLSGGPSTAPAVARSVGWSDDRARAVLHSLAAGGRAVRLNGSQWAAA